jgi:hypothetical protein
VGPEQGSRGPGGGGEAVGRVECCVHKFCLFKEYLIPCRDRGNSDKEAESPPLPPASLSSSPYRLRLLPWVGLPGLLPVLQEKGKIKARKLQKIRFIQCLFCSGQEKILHFVSQVFTVLYTQQGISIEIIERNTKSRFHKYRTTYPGFGRPAPAVRHSKMTLLSNISNFRCLLTLYKKQILPCFLRYLNFL